MLVGVSLWPAQASARGLEEVMRDAVQARDSGDLNRTVELLWEAYRLQPAPEILNNLGKMLEQLGRYREAYDAYKKVTDDPEADQSLRALDSSRIATLQPKLNKAWLLPKIVPEDATVLVDGEPTGMPPGVEFGVSHGMHALQVEHPDIEDIMIRFGRYPMDRRMDFAVDLHKLGAHLGRLDLGSRPRPKEIRINGKPVAGDLDRPGAVWLVPGTYDVVVVGAFDATGRLKVDLAAGDIAQLPEAKLVGRVERERQKVRKLTEADLAPRPDAAARAQQGPRESSFLDVVPWITTGLGAVAGGAGAIMMAGVQGDKNSLSKALAQPSDDLWTVNGQEVSVPSMSYAEARAEQDRIDAEGQQATLVMGVGAGVLVGSLIWAFIIGGDEDVADSDGAAPPLRLSPVALTPGGVTMGGRF